MAATGEAESGPQGRDRVSIAQRAPLPPGEFRGFHPLRLELVDDMTVEKISIAIVRHTGSR
jgi:hypothetical protein